jgi:DNA-binding transcriptional LysR family regulator
MTLKQLRYVCEVVRHDMSVSRAADSLGMSQPGLSRQIAAIEREVGVEIFVRSKKRFLRLTEPGEHVHRVAARMLLDAETLASIAREFVDENRGVLTIATTHTQARYALPRVVQAFAKKYPAVSLRLRQGTPSDASRMVAMGTADLSIATMPVEPAAGLVFLPCYELPRVVLVPAGHPLEGERKLTLAKLARYPLITYDHEFISHSRVLAAFEKQGLRPSVVLNAIDADVIKTYVELGMGIAIFPAIAYDARRDKGLRALSAGHLFQANVIHLGIRENDYLRGYAYAFIAMFAPRFDRAAVQCALDTARTARGGGPASGPQRDPIRGPAVRPGRGRR